MSNKGDIEIKMETDPSDPGNLLARVAQTMAVLMSSSDGEVEAYSQGTVVVAMVGTLNEAAVEVRMTVTAITGYLEVD